MGVNVHANGFKKCERTRKTPKITYMLFSCHSLFIIYSKLTIFSIVIVSKITKSLL